MTDRIADLELRLAAVEGRLRAIEEGLPDVPDADQISSEATLGEGFLSRASTLIGRVLLIFGGAYLLRAITDYEFVPTAVGIFLGAGYAIFWLFMAYRKGRIEDQRATALFYGGASIFLALPLLVEATTRFGLLSGRQAIIALSLFWALCLLVAVSRNLRSLGWLVTAGCIMTAFVIMNTSRTAIPVPVFLLILGLGSLWAVYIRQWLGLQWLGALGANAGIIALALLSRSEQWSVEPFSPYLLGSVMLAAYLLSFSARSHIQGRDVGLFEAVQILLAIGIVSGVASAAARAGQLNLAQVGVLSLVLGSGAYGLAFTPGTRLVRGRNFFFYSTLGLGLVVAGSALLMAPGKAAVAWSLMALALALFSGRYGRVTLSLQCTFLLIAAGVGSGILAAGFQALAGNGLTSWPPLLPWQLIVALTTVACVFVPVAQHSDRWGALAGLPQLVVLALSVWEVGGLIVIYLAPALARVPGTGANLAVLAALRTAVLAIASVTLALSSNHRRWPEARWLVYPVLILVGIKLFLEDFPHGQPVTLFIALALVGSALIAVSKLLAWKKANTQPALGDTH